MLISHINKPHIYITMGDPCGIGPEVIIKAMASPEIKGLAIFSIIADSEAIRHVNDPSLSVELEVHDLEDISRDIELKEDKINIIDPGPALDSTIPGEPTEEGSKKALKCLDIALSLMMDPQSDVQKALVTAPLSKERIASIYPGFIGHTEYLQAAYSVKQVTMVMVGKNLCVVPVTRHIPVKDISLSLSSELLTGTLKQVIDNRYLLSGKDDAIIGVCALNPHCGENGKIGTEEIEIIKPVVDKVKAGYSYLEGPISADVIFYKAIKGDIDIVVSMYHDQCLSPFKMVDFDTGVNITLGIGHIRTSPDHGTAFDIAGKGMANPGSMIEAIKLALRAVKSGNISL